MYGEVFHWDGGSDVPDVAELLFADARRGAAHALGLPLQGEETFTHADTHTTMHFSECPDWHPT